MIMRSLLLLLFVLFQLSVVVSLRLVSIKKPILPCTTHGRPANLYGSRCNTALAGSASGSRSAADRIGSYSHGANFATAKRTGKGVLNSVWKRLQQRLKQWKQRGSGIVRNLVFITTILLGGSFVGARPSIASSQLKPPTAIVRSVGAAKSSTASKLSTATKTASSSSGRSKNVHLVASSKQQQADSEISPAVVQKEVEQSWRKLLESLEGAKQDTLIMLIATSVVIPLFTQMKVSPIVGFMIAGMLIGPSGLNWVTDIHTVDKLGELGIVFFLFEMGLELSLERLKAMRTDVFGLGTSQFLLTSAVGALVSRAFGLSTAAAVTIGGSLALSSSAFVLQLLKDNNDMGTRFGKASFGILLLQDLAVVPLLVVVELLSKGGAGLGRALAAAGVKAIVTLTTLSFLGRKLLDPIFCQVARSSSHEAFLSIILTTVLLMSFVTKGIGLSDTLGAFLAGLLLSETSYRYQIESDISPFRGLLFGLFFITVGFSIDIGLLLTEPPTIAAMLLATIVGKASIITLLSLLFGIPLASAQQAGLLNAQVGELAFVAFGIAQRSNMLPTRLCKLLLTTVALSMACTPLLAMLGKHFSRLLEQDLGFDHYVNPDIAPLDKRRVRTKSPAGADSTSVATGASAALTTSSAVTVDSSSISSTTLADASANAAAAAASALEEKNVVNPSVANFVFICGYGRVGQLLCEMLDRRLISYVVLENNPQRAIEARNKGLPVYYGDVNRAEVLQKFNVDRAKACVLTLEDMSATNKAVVRIRKLFPNLPIVARAKNQEHKKRLQQMVDNVFAETPALPEDSVLLTLPFAGAVLKNVGVSQPEMEQIMEDVRKMHLDDYEERVNADQEFTNLIDIFRRRGSPSVRELRALELQKVEDAERLKQQQQQLNQQQQQLRQQQNMTVAAVTDAIASIIKSAEGGSSIVAPVTIIERAAAEIASSADILEKIDLIGDMASYTSEDLVSGLLRAESSDQRDSDEQSDSALEETRIEEFEMQLDAIERREADRARTLEIAREAYAVAILDGLEDGTISSSAAAADDDFDAASTVDISDADEQLLLGQLAIDSPATASTAASAMSSSMAVPFSNQSVNSQSKASEESNLAGVGNNTTAATAAAATADSESADTDAAADDDDDEDSTDDDDNGDTTVAAAEEEELTVKVLAKDREVIEGVCDEKGFLPDVDSSEISYRDGDLIAIPAPSTVRITVDAVIDGYGNTREHSLMQDRLSDIDYYPTDATVSDVVNSSGVTHPIIEVGNYSNSSDSIDSNSIENHGDRSNNNSSSSNIMDNNSDSVHDNSQQLHNSEISKAQLYLAPDAKQAPKVD